jgi:hypothetical protein
MFFFFWIKVSMSDQIACNGRNYAFPIFLLIDDSEPFLKGDAWSMPKTFYKPSTQYFQKIKRIFFEVVSESIST